MLTAELAALRDEDVDLGLLGFDESEIDRLLAGTNDELADLDDAPSPRPSQSAVPAICGFAGSIVCCAVTPLFWRMSRQCSAASSPTWLSPIHRTM